MLMRHGYGNDIGREKMIEAKEKGWFDHKAFRKMFFFCKKHPYSQDPLGLL
jgi:hypothetical protein|tara:strand:- start:2747 stop:2899 length:153 start_codon:yes stop_codon:yes gene_type:complete